MPLSQHRRPTPPNRAAVTVATAAAATAVALSSGPGSAHAVTAQTLAQAQKQVEALRGQAGAADEQYNGALVRREQMQRQVNAAQDQVAAQQSAVNQQMDAIGAMAAAQYRDGGLGETVGLMTSKDPTQYLDGASAIQQVDRAQQGQLRELKDQETALAAAKSRAQDALAAQDAQTQQMAQDRQQAQAKLVQAQQVLDRLTAEQRAELARQAAAERAAQLAAARKAQQEAAAAAAAAAAKAKASAGSSGVSVTVGGSSGSGSGVGARALSAAEGKIGAPYVWAAAGPSSFDCSGLVQWAYAQVGISLPHYSYADETVGSSVASLADAQPGDIVVMLGGEHVGLYAGKNSSGQYMILHAPYPGAYVRLESIDTIGSVTAIRRM